MDLDFAACYRAVAARDARFDGRFYTGVVTTGVYCRPICPSRTPARRNVRFFPHPAAAEAAGFRACRRCRPEAGPGSPEHDARADLVGRALRLIADGAVDAGGVRGLADRLHVTARHLHRLFVAELGAGPLAVARTRRLQLARRLLTETALPVTEIAYASGFGSIRQFNATVRAAYGRPPGELRGRVAHPGAGLAIRLGYREPLDAGALLGFLAARAVPGVEEVGPGRYARTVAGPGGAGVIELLLPDPGAPGAALLRARLTDVRGIGQVVARARRLLDLDADPYAVDSALAADPALRPLVARRPGLRLPGAYDGFELAVRAVLGQQVSVAAASTLAGRIVARCGEPLAEPAGALTHLFPTPAALAAADLDGLGLTGGRRRTLRALAAAVAAGELDLDPGADPDATRTALLALPGIGPWTASYIAMRALHDPDAYPTGDLALARAARRLGVEEAGGAAWRPWRGYAALHLWASLADPTDPTGPTDHEESP